MPAKKYKVRLENDERNRLLEMRSKGAIGARKLKRAQILLKADEGWKDEPIIQGVEHESVNSGTDWQTVC